MTFMKIVKVTEKFRTIYKFNENHYSLSSNNLMRVIFNSGNLLLFMSY